MTIEQLFGTLQQSVVDIWREHLKTDKYSAHMAMDEYYKDMPELIDTLIENYIGRYGKVLSYESVLNPSNFTSPVEYLTSLRDMVSNTYETISASELKSDLDAIISQIDSTVYKLRELTESEDVEFTLEEGAGEYNRFLNECGAGCKRGTKKDSEEECELTGKKKGNKKDNEEEELQESCKGCKKDDDEEECVNCKKKKGTKKDNEEECELKESVVGKKVFTNKYKAFGKAFDSEEECETGGKKKKPVKESLSEFLSRTLK